MATLTRITGYLYDATGAIVETGNLRITAQQDFISVDGTKVVPFTKVIDLSDTTGYIDVSLYALEGATPAGLAYYVEFDPNPAELTKPMKTKDGYWNNYWSVPNTTAIVPIGNFTSARRGTPAENYMPLSGSLSTTSDTMTLGQPLDTSKRFIANSNAASKPEIRFNVSTDKWEFSHDGLTFYEFGAAGVASSSADELVIGTLANTTKEITANQPGTDKPQIRFNHSTGKWEFSHNGVQYYELQGVATSGAAEYDAGNSGTAKTIDWSLSLQQIVTMTGNCTFTFTNGLPGRTYRLLLVQDATGGRTSTWPANIKWESDTAPTLDTTANKVAFLSFVYTGLGNDGFIGFASLLPISQP